MISLALGLQLLVVYYYCYYYIITIIIIIKMYFIQPSFRVRGIKSQLDQKIGSSIPLQHSQFLSCPGSSSWAPLMHKSRETERLNGLSKVTQLGDCSSKKLSLFELVFLPIPIHFIRVPDSFSAFILSFHSCCLHVYQVSQHFISKVPHSGCLLSCTSQTLTCRSMVLATLYLGMPAVLQLPLSQCQSESL